MVSAQDSDPDSDDVPETLTDWRPDEHLVASIFAGRSTLRLANLNEMDRAWLAAASVRAKFPAKELARLLDCSVRTLRVIIASGACKAFIYAQTETETWIREKALADAGRKVLEQELLDMSADLERTRGKLNRLVDAQIVGMDCCGRCSTPWDKVNTYWYGGKRHCRNCQAVRNRNYRANKRSGVIADLELVVAQAVDAGILTAGQTRDLGESHPAG